MFIQKKMITAVFLSSFVLLGMTACNDDAEAQYQEKLEELQDAKSDKEANEKELAELREEQEAAKKAMKDELDEAKKALADAEQEVKTAREEASKAATDTTIFQTLQEKYVTDSQFENSRIAVIMNGGRVMLKGAVDSNEVMQAAINVAKQTVGVQAVSNQLVIRMPAEAAE